MAENRLFAAIAFAQEERRALRRAAEPVLARCRGRIVDASLYHITLRFFGPVPPQRMEAITAAMARSAAQTQPFPMESGLAGRFGNPASAVLWLGLKTGQAELTALHGILERELVAAGWLPEDRPFRSHITLGRDVDTRPVEPLGGMALEPVPLRARGFTLYDSVRREGMLRYETVFEVLFEAR